MDTVAQLTPRLPPKLPPFDPDALRQASPTGQFILWLATHPFTMGLLRRFWPTARVPKVGRVISRYDDAQEALSRPEIFQVPWALKMQLLAPSERPFVLAADGSAEHRSALRPIMRVFKREDMPRIAGIAARTAERAIQNADGKIDAVKDLISKVPVAIYRDYYGLDVSGDEFVLWLMAISNYTFRRIGPDPVAEKPALAAAKRVARIVDDAIERTREGRGAGDTIVARLVRLQAQEPDVLPGDALRTSLIGMTTGNDPVATSAGGNILQVLLARPKAMAAARQAALDDDDEALSRCLLEALRFRPINPGLWRVCCKDYTIAAGTSRATRILQGEKVLVFLQAAMQDSERVRDAGRFDPDRPAPDSMVFGYGIHWCVGAPLAVAQLTQTFKPLLVRGFSRAPGKSGRTQRFGAFPERLTLVLGQR